MNNKDLIKQYVNTGLELPEYQISRLSNKDLRSYLRVRLNSGSVLSRYEMDRLSSDEIKTYVLNRLKKGNMLNSFEYNHLDDKYKDMYAKHNYFSSSSIEKIGMDSLDDDYINRVIKLRSSKDILNNLYTIMHYAISKQQVIHKLIDEKSEIFNDNYNLSYLFRYLNTNEQKTAIAIRLMNKYLENAEDGFNTKNSPMSALLENLDSPIQFIKYILDTNLKLNGGEKFKMDGETLFTLFEYIKDNKFIGLLVQYIDKHVDLEPTEQNYINYLKTTYNL